MTKLTASDVSHGAREIYVKGRYLRRLMMYSRPYICPFEELIARVPQGATVLDVGCGDGLFLNILVQVERITGGLGFDSNSKAIANARLAKENLAGGERLQFVEWSAGQSWPAGSFNVVSMIDVLHHIPVGNKEEVIQKAVDHVEPGGVLLFKDIGCRPKWRALFNSLHDLILTGQRVSYTPLDVVVSWVSAAGMREKERLTVNRLWYGHEVAVFLK